MVDTSNPIVENLPSQIQVSVVEDKFPNSQNSNISELTDISNLSQNEEVHWSVWLFGDSGKGGKRKKMRKSRRIMRTFKSKKVRSGKRRCNITKRRRTRNRTLKRYKSKAR
jgi:hypothetical protein